MINFAYLTISTDLQDIQNQKFAIIEKASNNDLIVVYANDLKNWDVKQGMSERSVQLVREHANTPQVFAGANSLKHSRISKILTAC